MAFKIDKQQGYLLKVLVLHPPMYPVNYDFYNYLGEKVDLTIFQYGEYPSDHPNWTTSLLVDNQKNFNLKVFGKGSDSLRNQLFSLQISDIRDLNPDVVLSIAFWIPSFYYSLLSKVFRFKFLILTNAIFATDGKNSYLKKLYRKIICKNTTAFISASKLTTEYLSSICSNNIYLSVQTIETKKWRQSILELRDKKQLRKELMLPLDKIIVLGVGNFNYKKNWISMIKEMKNLHNVFFVLVGSGENYSEYKQYITKNELKNKIQIVDRKEGIELKKYFKSSDIFILPSLYEQFGFVVAEALSSDLAVLCSKNTGASSLIIDDVNGYIIDPNESFARYLQMVVDNLDYLQSNSYNSIKTITLQNRAGEFYSIFKKALS